MSVFAPYSMEIRGLVWTMLIVGFIILFSVQFTPFGEILGARSCERQANKFFEKPRLSNYSLQNQTKDIPTQNNVDILRNETRGSSNSTIEKEIGPKEEKNRNKRVLRPYGNAAYLFIQMGAYRGGADSFAVVGLASKPLYVFGKPWFECEWIPKDSTLRSVKGKALKTLPDWGYGRVYTVVVVNCKFSEGVGTEGSGGDLIIHAHHSDGIIKPERIVALTEKEKSYNFSVFNGPPPYDYLYCGSPLYGDLSPDRIREWMAYHDKFFGPRSHFVLHDAGGVHPEVRKVLDPWIQSGRVTLQDITDQEQYDGYYHNQFLVLNDCLHRYKFMANWTFFFDVDEYLYIPQGRNLHSIVDEFSSYTQFTIEQFTMSDKLCLAHEDSQNLTREWGLEKLVFRNVKRGIRRDRKYAIQARNAYATGVHMSVNLYGKSLTQTRGKIRYYHYHNTISVRGELCREFVNASMQKEVTWLDKTPYVYDGTMKDLAASIKQSELH